MLTFPMDREMLECHLAEAEEHIATGGKNIARQRKVIAQLERDGRDTASARTFLIGSAISHDNQTFVFIEPGVHIIFAAFLAQSRPMSQRQSSRRAL
jgi:hypothetical protein